MHRQLPQGLPALGGLGVTTYGKAWLGDKRAGPDALLKKEQRQGDVEGEREPYIWIEASYSFPPRRDGPSDHV